MDIPMNVVFWILVAHVVAVLATAGYLMARHLFVLASIPPAYLAGEIRRYNQRQENRR